MYETILSLYLTAKAYFSAYRAQHASDVQAYLDERSHLERSHHMIDETLEYVDYTDLRRQAYATQSEFRAQRDTLSSIHGRLTSITGQVPGLQSLISLIARRRRRDNVILALVIGICLVLLLWTGTRRT